MFTFRRQIRFFLLGAIIWATSSCSSVSTRPAETAPLSKAAWMRALPQSMSEELCGAESPFLKCYSIPAEECRQQAQAVTVSCEQKYFGQIPESLRGQEISRWGGAIGECAGENLFDELQTRYAKVNTAECQAALSASGF